MFVQNIRISTKYTDLNLFIYVQVAEYREIKKRAMRAKGKKRTGPDGLLNRPS